MSHFIVRNGNKYLYHRRSTPDDRYMARSEWGGDKGQARVFTKRGAATTASGGHGEVIEVELKEIKA